MAAIVVGIAASHSPRLSTPSELWRLHAELDRQTSIGHAFNFVRIRARPARAADGVRPLGITLGFPEACSHGPSNVGADPRPGDRGLSRTGGRVPPHRRGRALRLPAGNR